MGASGLEIARGTLQVEGLSVAYLAAGPLDAALPSVVLVHGLGAAKSWWRHTIPALAARFRVYALDLPAHGESAVPQAVPDAGFGARFLLAALDALGLPRAALVGQSLGGYIALQVAIQARQRVSRLVLVDSAGLGRDLNWLLRVATLPGWGELLLGVLGRYRWEIRREYGALFHDPSVLTEEMAEEIKANRDRPRASAVLLAMLRRGVTWRGVKRSVLLLDQLSQVRAPALMIWGDGDPLFPLSHARSAQEGMPGSRLEVFAACGHCPQLEYPERFNRSVTDFLARPAPLDA
ncbi:MAG: alpha/beta fold hydrolase [Dehalococcoidia bacterium]|nr:alpha/beta fold hydrolase [Dehalococcoidia bacterium]